MFVINLDTAQFEKNAKELADTIEAKAESMVRDVARAGYDHIIDLADKELKTLKTKYIDGVKFEQLDQYSWMISMTDKTGWIETGLDPGFQMLPGFINSPNAKTAKDGSKYLVIPIEKNNGQSDSTDKASETKELLKRELAASKPPIPFADIEHDSTGKPKLGVLHKLDIATGRKGLTGVPYLMRTQISQTQTDKGVQRSIMTWRTATSKQSPSEYWVLDSGKEGLDAFSRTVDFIETKWAEMIKEEFGGYLT